MSGYRLDNFGQFIDRTTKLDFTFDGKQHQGYLGDTLASSLLASGQTIFGRSFKYHRPRGVMSAGVEETNALVTLRSGDRSEPNTKATIAELFEGLEATSQNNWPSLRFDLMSWNNLISPLLVAGFYYKTFIGTGQRTWHFFEPLIRRAAGMGRGTLLPDPDRYDKIHTFCDVLVVGGGVAGLMVADVASASGAEVIFADENAKFGGAIYEETGQINNSTPVDWYNETLNQVKARENVKVVPRLTVNSCFDNNVLSGVERVADHIDILEAGQPRQRHWIIVAKQVVFATGAIERPLVFAGNDLPGVMLAESANRYASRYGVAVGKNVVIFANNDMGYRSALSLKKAGVKVEAIIDPRESGTTNSNLESQINEHGITVHNGAVVSRAHGTKRLTGVSISKYNADSEQLTAEVDNIKCDALAVSGGWTPNVQLCSQVGTPPEFDKELQTFLPGKPLQKWIAAGSVAGHFTLQAAMESGIDAGNKVVEELGKTTANIDIPQIETEDCVPNPMPIWNVPTNRRLGKKFVDFQHDVTTKDVELAQREGFESVEHLKRYTTLGMAADQGKTSNINGLALMAKARGISIEEVGTTRFRPPYSPISFGVLSGREQGEHLRPTRRTPMHQWHLKNGAKMMTVGAWMRPQIYPKPGETIEQAYIRETQIVREKVGMVDVSTLGKIDIQGPDAAEFINRVYANGFLSLPVNKARYGIMLREDGFVYDDGTTWRLSETQYLMTTTTANAAGVMSQLEYFLAVVWPELKVRVNSVSDQWGAMAIAGPNSRTVLQKVVTNLDLNNDEFPFMKVGQGKIDGKDVLIARLSFSGELAYEVFCGWLDGEEIWETIMDAGEEYGIVPYGMEALGALRIEKGHVAGPELNGRTTMADLGLGKMASKKKYYIGSAMMEREGLIDKNRKTLVGLISQSNQNIMAGAHLIEVKGNESLGHVTSVTYSPALGQFIALALLKNGQDRIGSSLIAIFPMYNKKTNVKVVDPHFYDKEGGKLYV